MRQWRPYKAPNSLGLDILLLSELNKQELISFIKNISIGMDIVIINIYTDLDVYENAQKDYYTKEFDEHFVLIYIKNTTIRRAYYGFNEIRWMQQTGRFSGLYGTQTQM